MHVLLLVVLQIAAMDEVMQTFQKQLDEHQASVDEAKVSGYLRISKNSLSLWGRPSGGREDRRELDMYARMDLCHCRGLLGCYGFLKYWLNFSWVC